MTLLITRNIETLLSFIIVYFQCGKIKAPCLARREPSIFRYSAISAEGSALHEMAVVLLE